MTRERRVGIFVAVGLIITTVAIFLIGQNRKFWQRKVRYTAVYSQVAGLKAGSPVSMGGVDVGVVGEVRYADDPKDAKIYVGLDIVKDQAPRIRKDVYEDDGKTLKYPGTVARVVNKGLLGDKMIELTVGDQRFPEAVPNTQLRTEEPMDLGKYITKLESIGEKAEKTLGNIERITGSLANDKFSQDLQGTVAAVHDILDAVAHNKDGAAHKLLFDKQEAQKIEALLSNLVVISGNVSAITNDVHGMTTRVNQGPGLAHALLYDEQMAQGVTGSLVELKNTLEAVRTKEGLAHAVVYGDPNTQKVLQNVGAMSDDMRVVVANVRQGKGTIGGLLVDPSIYEDLKAIVGNVERNQVLRALVRYSIKEGEQKPHAETPKLSTPASAPPKAEAQK